MMCLIFQISYNGIDWFEVPKDRYAVTPLGAIVPNMLFIGHNATPFYIRVVVKDISDDT